MIAAKEPKVVQRRTNMTKIAKNTYGRMWAIPRRIRTALLSTRAQQIDKGDCTNFTHECNNDRFCISILEKYTVSCLGIFLYDKTQQSDARRSEVGVERYLC